MSTKYTEQLPHSSLRRVVHDHVVDDLAALRLLAGGQLQPAGHVLVVVSPGPEPLGLGLGRGRHEQDHDSGGIGGPDLPGPLHVDLQQHVLARRRLRRRRAVQVTEIRRGLEEASLPGPGLERGAVDEVVRVLPLSRAARSGRPRPAQPQRRVGGGQALGHGALADPSRAGYHEDQERAVSRSNASRWFTPSPWTRRDSLIPMSSIIRRAFTLPNPGSDSRTEITFIFPTVSFCPPCSSNSSRLSEPILSFSFSSARARRAAAAFSRAAWR